MSINVTFSSCNDILPYLLASTNVSYDQTYAATLDKTIRRRSVAEVHDRQRRGTQMGKILRCVTSRFYAITAPRDET